MKRFVSVTALILTLALLVTGCGVGSAPAPKPAATPSQPAAKPAPTELVISIWGLATEDQNRVLFKPFEQKHNAKVVLEVGNNAERLSKVRAGGTKVDLIFLSDYFAQQGVDEGLFDKINYNNVPNIKELYDFAQKPLGEGYGPCYTVSRFGIIYNTQIAKKPVESWKDLWNAEWKKNISMPDITTTTGPMLVLMAARINGGNEQNPDAGFKALARNKANVHKFYARTSELQNLLQTGEVAIAPALHAGWPTVKKMGKPYKWVDPKEGPVAVINTINIVKGSKNKELAEKFLNFILDKDIQEAIAKARIDSPVNKNVKLPDDVAADLTYGEALIKSLVVPNWGVIVKQLPQWIDRWNREISK